VAGRVLVIQHVPNSSLGVYGDVLDERGDETVIVRLHRAERLPDGLDGLDGIVSLGAPTSVYDGGPEWVPSELRFLRQAVESDVPVWGICYGAQALAAALGARVWPGPAPEVGIHSLRLAPAAASDPVFGSLPETLPMFHWHGDSFDLPDGATLLAGTDAYPHQAFRAGRSGYGVQFHAETTRELVNGWIDQPQTAGQLEAAHGPGAAVRLRAEAGQALPSINQTARALMAAWRETAEG
jgi:GMP synthase (glutamine-hydrolysing)